MTINADRILEMLKELDTLETTETQLVAEIQKNGAAWALERFAAEVFYARQMARLVRPLVEAYGEVSADVWIAGVCGARDDAMRQLIGGCYRSNSTSILQNAVNQWEALAISKFVDYTRYWGLDA